jgi:hypothetical protein
MRLSLGLASVPSARFVDHRTNLTPPITNSSCCTDIVPGTCRVDAVGDDLEPPLAIALAL